MIAAANKRFSAAAWNYEKQVEIDIGRRNRASGGMPSHCYRNRDMEAADDTLVASVDKDWNRLTSDNRKYAIEMARDDCMPDDLKESVFNRALLGCSPPPEPFDTPAPCGNAQNVIDKLGPIRKEKKKRQRAELEVKREKWNQKREAKQAAKRAKLSWLPRGSALPLASESDSELCSEYAYSTDATDFDEWEEEGFGKWDDVWKLE